MNKKKLLGVGIFMVCIMLVSVGCGSSGGAGTNPSPTQSGTISVTSSASGASFTITGSASYSGTTPWSTSSAPGGTYTITWGALSGYTAPSSETKSLSSSGSISFIGNYVHNTAVVASAAPDQIILGGYYASFGGYVEAGNTLSLSWSADSSLDCFILTQNQLNNVKNSLSGIISVWEAYGSGSSGTISAQIQNSDTYYAIVRNTSSLGPSVKLYHAELTEQ